eukprot:2418207-Pleurochrysis_carterae.AAC.6
MLSRTRDILKRLSQCHVLLLTLLYFIQHAEAIATLQGILRLFKLLAAGRAGSLWLYANLWTFCVVPRWRATTNLFLSAGPWATANGIRESILNSKLRKGLLSQAEQKRQPCSHGVIGERRVLKMAQHANLTRRGTEGAFSTAQAACEL